MDISIINVHLDLGAGRRGTDMGPSAMHVAGLVPALERIGHRVTGVSDINVETAEQVHVGAPNARFLPQILSCCTELADRVEHALDNRQFPLVLGGDHAQAIGTIAGMARHLRKQGQHLGVVWVDAHTDMNTPDTSPSGNIHGMPLAVLLGRGPKELQAIFGDEPALRPQDVAVVGARDVDAGEAPLVRELGVRVFTMSEIDARGTTACVTDAMDIALRHTRHLHLSFDLDGVDPDAAPGVGTPVPGGLTLRESLLACELANKTRALTGMEMVELNPTLDHENKTGKLAVWLIATALGKRIL